MERIYKHFRHEFDRAVDGRDSTERRIGAELKFPLVNRDGTAADFETVCELWKYLAGRGWEPVADGTSGRVVGARKPGEKNDTVASCETGYCKTEFSLAHVANLFEADRAVRELREELAPFADDHEVSFLGYGIQPVTGPSKKLLFKKERSSVWDKAVPSNHRIPQEKGDDVHLFTINAASHVHTSVRPEEAIAAVNVLNGFAGPQIALTAHSNVWQGREDGELKSVAETMWDWWEPARMRCGVPPKPFESLEDYVRTIGRMRPIYVKRDDGPVVLTEYDSFAEYYRTSEAVGRDLEGDEVPVVPAEKDIDLHNSCYWYTARISRYFTVENRVHDQQPPGQLVCVAALTLGLVSALDDAWEALSDYSWDELRDARRRACREGLAGANGGPSLVELAERMLDVAGRGLARRGLGEEAFLDPLHDRLAARTCPADEVSEIFQDGGIDGLVAARAL